MASKVTIDSLGAEMEKILTEYGEDVTQNLSSITKEVGKKGVQLLKNESLNAFPDSKKHRRRYGSTWTSRTEERLTGTKITLYNTQAGLPHLLENGHALVAGGRQVGTVAGRTHIAPVEAKLQQLYESEVLRKL